MYSSKYQMKYLIKKYEIKRDTNMIKPIKIPIWIVFLVLPLIEFSVSLSVKPLLCPPDSGELGASMTCPEVARFPLSASARMVPRTKVVHEKTVPRQPNPTNCLPKAEF